MMSGGMAVAMGQPVINIYVSPPVIVPAIAVNTATTCCPTCACANNNPNNPALPVKPPPGLPPPCPFCCIAGKWTRWSDCLDGKKTR